MDTKQKWRYYEGTTSANNIIKDLSKVVCAAVKTEPLKDSDGNIIKDKEIMIDQNWDIVYPQPQKDLINVMDWSKLTPSEYEAKIQNQINQATDTIILKTKTTDKDLSSAEQTDDIGLENDLDTKSIEMYVELYKPKYLADPEKYDPECERKGIMPYCITQDIFKEYSNNQGSAELDMLGISSPEISITYPVSTNYQLNSSRSSDYAAKVLELYNIIYEKSATLPDWGATDNYNIGTNILVQKLKGTELLDLISNLLGISTEEVLLSDSIKISVSYSGSGYYNVQFTTSKSRQHYETHSGFEYQLPELDHVNADSVQLILNNQGSQTALDSTYFEYNRTTYKLKILKTFSGYSDTVGTPVIKYGYEKESTAITAKTLLYNNHYIYMRMFDNIKEDFSGPLENVIDDNTGNIMQMKSHVSEWSKLSWYQDFEEILIDSIDSSVGESDLTKGKLFLPVDTPGLNGDTRIRFWVNTNNDRAPFVIMGNPSLDFGKNRHLISAGYLGQIESFENSINDTAGNFALFTSSSTNPCASKSKKIRLTLTDTQSIAVGDNVQNKFEYTISDNKFFDALGDCSVVYDDGTTKTVLKNGSGFSVIFSADKKTATITTFSPPALGVTVSFEFNYYIEKYESIDGVTRDSFGNVVAMVMPDKYGKNTATGVIDISMLHTRSKAYFQKHHLMFTTTEEYMTKEMYGKSSYTGEYYADRMKITHGNDGPRGYLSGCLTIDTSSLNAFDELIVNRNFERDPEAPEETFIFFPITAPFSPFAGSPNATYGFAIKKSERYPEPVTDEEIVTAALNDIDVLVGNLHSLTEDIVLPEKSTNDLPVTWSSSKPDLIEIA